MVRQIWEIFVSSNAFNFIIMLVLLCLIVKKFNLKSLLDNGRQKIIDNIRKSDTLKDESQTELNNAKKTVENLDSEIEKIVENAKNKAENIQNNIISEASIRAKIYEDNVEKIIQSEENQVNSRLISKTVLKSRKNAEEKIKKMLDENPDLHNKLIEESIGVL